MRSVILVYELHHRKELAMRITTVKRMIICVLPVLVCFGCKDSVNSNDAIHGSGNVVAQARTVDVCEGVTVMSTGNVSLTQADNQSIRIEADDNIIGRVIAEKQNGILVVGLPDGSYTNVTVRIYVSMKTIKTLSIEGAGNIQSTNMINSQSLNCSINGAGNITLQGQGDDLSCSINGAGNFNAKNFTAKTCTAIVNGAGSCTVSCTDKLDATVSGVGSVYYYGNPATVNSTISGVGQITKGK
jgi:hypothetical protein